MLVFKSVFPVFDSSPLQCSVELRSFEALALSAADQHAPLCRDQRRSGALQQPGCFVKVPYITLQQPRGGASHKYCILIIVFHARG